MESEMFLIFAWVTIGIVAASSILMFLIIRSSDDFNVKEMEENSDEFAGIIRDSHGPVTKWLGVAYIVMVIWAIAYLIQHLAEL